MKSVICRHFASDCASSPCVDGADGAGEPGDRLRAKDRDLIVGLHAAYQMAVKRNDATTMRRILDDRFLLVLGDGKRYSRADVLASAANGKIRYENRTRTWTPKCARVWGHRRGYGANLGQRYQGRRGIRSPRLVQRHLRAHVEWLALCVPPGVAAAARLIGLQYTAARSTRALDVANPWAQNQRRSARAATLAICVCHGGCDGRRSRSLEP